MSIHIRIVILTVLETSHLKHNTLAEFQFRDIQWAQTAFVHDLAVLIIMTSKHFWLLQCRTFFKTKNLCSQTSCDYVTMWVCDPSLVSFALEQPEMLRNHEYRHKCHAPFKCAPTVLHHFKS